MILCLPFNLLSFLLFHPLLSFSVSLFFLYYHFLLPLYLPASSFSRSSPPITLSIVHSLSTPSPAPLSLSSFPLFQHLISSLCPSFPPFINASFSSLPVFPPSSLALVTLTPRSSPILRPGCHLPGGGKVNNVLFTLLSITIVHMFILNHFTVPGGTSSPPPLP